MIRILVTDDNSDYRASVMDLLKLSDYDVIGAENGEVALKRILSDLPDIVLCDVDMPVMDGLIVLKHVRETPKTRALPFIIITGNTSKVTSDYARQLGATDYITKPINVDELLGKIAKYVTSSEE